MHFSDGTLRLIGLLWSVAEVGGPLLLEEPELSLNDAIVAQMPAMFDTMQRLSGRQVILTTHASALLDAPGVGLAELHILKVDENGTSVQTASDNEQFVALIGGGLSIAEAVFPTLRPPRAETLGTIGIAA
jgi:predicted ATPase